MFGLLDLFVNRRNARKRAALAEVLPEGYHVNAVEIEGDEDGDGWIRIVPFGEFPFHHNGAHAITPEAGRQMVANFDARPGGLLFDVDHDSLWGRTKAAAWSDALEVRDDGVYCRAPELTAYGEAEVAGRQYCFYSPVYALSAVDKRGEQIGAVLHSVAYTNTPYFDEGEIDAAVNSSTQTPRPVDPQTLELLGLPADATDEQIANAVKALNEKANAAPSPATPAETPDPPDAPGAEGDVAKVNARVAALEEQLETERQAAADARAEALVDAAVNSGRIKPAQRTTYVNAAKADFEATKQELDAIAEGDALPGRLAVNRAAAPAASSAVPKDVADYVNSQVAPAA